jgi:hypothetical protein
MISIRKEVDYSFGLGAIALSTDHFPPPPMRSAIHTEIARRWYSNPSPFWVPNQFIKKPFGQ